MNDRPEVVAIYCPLWHNYDHASSWKGEGWCEWELLKSAIPRFDGHYQPLQPEWGTFDESDPAWADREVVLAADHGIDVMLFDWYWYNGVRIMEEALERGFLGAPNRKRVKFALMWANHDWADYFPAPFGKDWNSWLPMRHSKRDFLRVIDYGIERYFREPNYWTTGGGLFFSVFVPAKFVEELGGPVASREILAEADRRLERAGLPPLHMNAMVGNSDPVSELKDAGFHSTTSYNFISSGTAGPDFIERYEDLAAMHPVKWREIAAAPLPYLPVVTMGWDVTPRCEKHIPWPFPDQPGRGPRSYPYGPVVVGNTPELFGKLCGAARQHLREFAPVPNAVLVNAWNEWTEGCYLLPEKRYGDGFLKALRGAFS
ncbi:MAG: glycoside hydrolase family 99-like domain-containing protein [Candidatus Hydrogenedentes bacterium]|nr:glycoside hydrolase family 99-like domain-containing protein [Candidatus Hydrogenedentota bacterium]